MSPGGQTVVSMWGRDARDRGLEPNPFSLQEWRRARRLPEDPENPPLIGDKNPYGDWSKIRTKHLLKRYGCREKAPAFCPPEPDYVLVGAFNDVARDKDTKTPYKRCLDNMQYIGGAAHAMLSSMEPIFLLREQLGAMHRQVEQGTFPFHATVGPGSFQDWIENTAYDISNTVFRGVRDAAILGAAGFNEQIKTIRKMVVDHPRTESLPISIERCPPSEAFFCGGHDEYLKSENARKWHKRIMLIWILAHRNFNKYIYCECLFESLSNSDSKNIIIL